MSLSCRLLIVQALLLVLCVGDLVTSTLLALKISAGKTLGEVIKQQILHYHYAISTFDIWLSSVIRTALFAGLTLSFICVRSFLQKLTSLSAVIFLTLAVYFCFLVAKLLTSFEFYSDGSQYRGRELNKTVLETDIGLPCLNDTSVPCGLAPSNAVQPYHPWLWGLLGWSVAVSVLYALLYTALVHIIRSKLLGGGRHLYVSDEETPLLDSLENPTDSKNTSTFKIMTKCFRLAFYESHLFLPGYFFLVVSSTTVAFIPYYTGQIINHIAIEPSFEDFQHAILIMAAVTIISAMCAGLRGVFLMNANARLNIRIRRQLFKSLLKQEIGFFDVTDTGDLTSRLSADTTKLADQIGLNLNVLLRNLIQFVGSLVFMIQLTWKLSTITLVGIPFITVATKLFGGKLKAYAKKAQDSFAKANNVAEEVLSSMKTVRSFTNEDGEFKLFSLKLEHTHTIYKHASLFYGSWMLSSNLMALVLQVVTLYYGGHLVMYNEISGGELVSLLLYQVSLRAAMDAMGNVFTGLMQAAGAGEMVFELMERKPLDDTKGDYKRSEIKGKVEFRDVKFSYPSRPNVPVLKGVSFTALPGQVVALVGPSGGGKSSCISLLERFYTPTSGQVLLDGRDLGVYDHKHLHSKVSLVGQEPVLYARTIAENIAYGSSTLTQDDVENSARLANAHGFISNMIDGYDTHIGEKGGQLSGGQKQRVAIARALIREPNVLLLDEATSALDADSEHLVQQALSKNLHGRTVIVIAHTLSTVEKADKIVVIKEGRVVEVGTHSELLRKAGVYATMVSKQMMQNSPRREETDQITPLLPQSAMVQ